ncbi:MAG: efflux RND transporter periplasmic adaptor subunit [Beijerinckiaceae bacterium]|nr:efflux RND transporter periplasmic adaptor subunit [Beijerinckiaceae bacterium]
MTDPAPAAETPPAETSPAPEPRQTKTRLGARARRFVPLAVILLAGAGAAGWALTGKPPEKTAVASPDTIVRPVQVQAVRLQEVAQPKLLVGTVRARIEADQGFRVAGKIAARKVQVGDRIAAGTILASLDDTDFRLNRESAEAELAAARSAARQAELELERILDLRARGWSTEQASDRQRTTRDEAIGRVRRAERQVELTTNSQSYADLRAESDGIVISVAAEVGQVVAAGQTIVRIARDGDREALVALPEQELALARQGRAEAELWSEPGKRYPATLRELSPSADAGTRTFAARFTLAGIAPDAPLGMTATITLVPPEAGRMARIPLSAILNQGEGTEVFVVEPGSGQLARRKVEILATDGRLATIRAGLAEGEKVVTMGVHTLRAGQKVRVLTEARQG